MGALILLLLEIEIVLERRVAVLGATNGRELDDHVEFAPSFLVDGEGRVLEGLLGAFGAEGLVQVVRGFLEARGGQLLAFGADEIDGDGPFSHGEAYFGA